MGVDWFRQYLVIEFAEEGIDLYTAIRDMLARHRAKLEKEAWVDLTEEVRRATEDGLQDEQAGADGKGGGGGGEGAGEGEGGQVVAPAAEGEGGREAIAEAKETAGAAAAAAAAEEAAAAAAAATVTIGGGGGGEGGEEGGEEGEEFDIRKSGKDIFERFIKSGCCAECNLPGTVVTKVRKRDTVWAGSGGATPPPARACRRR